MDTIGDYLSHDIGPAQTTTQSGQESDPIVNTNPPQADSETPATSEGTPIAGKPTATLEQMKQWAAAHNASQQFIDNAQIYWDTATAAGIDPVVAYAQSARETSFGNFGDIIDASYYNPASLKNKYGGNNSDPAVHQKFSSWQEGIQAQIDHLALYAGLPGYPKDAADTPDPRQFMYLYGTAPTVEELPGKWATDTTYGEAIDNFIAEIAATATPDSQSVAYHRLGRHYIGLGNSGWYI